MAEKNQEENEIINRVYEAGYHIVPTVKEEDVDGIVSGIRTQIEKIGGSLIAEGAPSLMKLSFPMTKREGEKNVEYDRGYFGWIKFEAGAHVVKELSDTLNTHASILRSMVFKTLREDTRAKIKPPALREVKRTDTIKSSRKDESAEPAAPVSEVELEKALETLTAE